MRRRKAGNPELHPLHPLLHPERRLDLDLHKGRWCSGKASSVDTTWASVDTLSQIGQKVFWELSLVSTLPDLVSTLPDLFVLYLKHCVDTTRTSVDTT
ncbi:hypothetical protein Taro_044615 [Colocasia esculenta]|uniref:Uncharacterized protein n=1 Tax=Colocasia esculenta TaxID=4460 RepID=A0A843WV09_COLES|nr:hypothetical protein [Colocasia esculenta]